MLEAAASPQCNSKSWLWGQNCRLCVSDPAAAETSGRKSYAENTGQDLKAQCGPSRAA